MIASLSGKISEIFEDSLILQVGGVGLQVFIPVNSLSNFEVGQDIFLLTQFVVRETEMTLYGFSGHEEREFFNLLVGVNRVGPKLALAVLSSLSIPVIRRAVFDEKPEVLGTVSGVGKMTAQKIAMHLKNKIKDTDEMAVSVFDDLNMEVVEALTSLGYSAAEAQAAVRAIPKDTPEDLEDRLRIALAYFGK
jgi:Holliday junction DNA helicase RuvA